MVSWHTFKLFNSFRTGRIQSHLVHQRLSSLCLIFNALHCRYSTCHICHLWKNEQILEQNLQYLLVLSNLIFLYFFIGLVLLQEETKYYLIQFNLI